MPETSRRKPRPRRPREGRLLAVAVFGALIAHRASFLPGMRTSLLIAVVVLAVAAATAVTLPRPARENELTVLGR
jgi:hypothetical protein